LKNNIEQLTVSGLSIYPLKSCREITCDSSIVEKFGLKNDRRWMVVDENGVMLTQRKVAKMCLIQPELTDNGLMLSMLTRDSLYVEIPDDVNTAYVKVWNDVCLAYDAGDSAANWLSQALSTKCRLVYFPEDEFRQVDLDYANKGDQIAFSDGFPLLLISQASLDDLNQRLSVPITMNRFRPNIVIAGSEAYAEDSWKKVRVGDVTFRIVKPCSRCVIPSINIDTAKREAEPTKTLAEYRKRDNQIFFGQNVIADVTGKINLGMPVEIIE